MSENRIQCPVSARVVEVLETNALRIQAAVSAARLWDEVLTESERWQLGGDLPAQWCQLGAAGMWRKLRDVS